MRFLCPSCKAKYQIADERLVGRSVKAKCRKCGYVIDVSNQSSSQPNAEVRIAAAHRDGATKLDLSGLGLTHLPESLFGLKSLRHLNLSDNPLVTLPDDLARLDGLQYIAASHVGLLAFPKVLLQLTTLTSITLDRNEIVFIPPEIDELRNLEQISVGQHSCWGA